MTYIQKTLHGVPLKRFLKDLNSEISDDNVSNGAAALAYYFTLAIFPGMLFLLSLLPYLPIEHLDQAVMDLVRQAMPGQAAGIFSDTIREVTQHQKGGLLSFGALGTLWAASAGMYAVMQQLNITYDVKEGRSLLKARGISIALTLVFGTLLLASLVLATFGGHLQDLILRHVTSGLTGIVQVGFELLRWGIIACALLLAFAVTYYKGPDVEQKFQFITPGAVLGTFLLGLASLGLNIYISKFSSYEATYGSIGAVIILMLWLYVAGLVILVGSEINALIEHYDPQGKSKGEKLEPDPQGASKSSNSDPASARESARTFTKAS
jgi:membrane protein